MSNIVFNINSDLTSKVKIRIEKNNYLFLNRLYCKLDELKNDRKIRNFDDFLSYFLRGTINVLKNNIFEVMIDDELEYIDIFETKFIKFYINYYFENVYKTLKKGDFVDKNVRLYDDFYINYLDFGLMNISYFEKYFVVNRQVSYTRIINFFIFILKENENMIDYDELNFLIDEFIFDNDTIFDNFAFFVELYLQIFEKNLKI